MPALDIEEEVPLLGKARGHGNQQMGQLHWGSRIRA